MDLFPGALRGMGYSLVPMILSVIGTVGMRIFWIFVIFPSHRTLYDLFISYPASWTATIIMQVICYSGGLLNTFLKWEENGCDCDAGEIARTLEELYS